MMEVHHMYRKNRLGEWHTGAPRGLRPLRSRLSFSQLAKRAEKIRRRLQERAVAAPV